MGGSRRVVQWAAAAIAVPALLLTAPAAGAAEPDQAGVDVSGDGGCSGAAVSSDADGNPLGLLNTKSGVAASPDAPLVIASNGSVRYTARSEQAITDNSWTVRVGGVPVKSGTSANAQRKQVTLGTAQVSDYLPVPVTGLMLVEVEITGDGGIGCTGSAWVKLDGNGWTSADGLLGLALLVLGLIGIGFARPVAAHGAAGGVRSHGLRGALFGVLAGLGLALLLVSLAVIPFGTYWLPLAVVAAGLVVGLLFGKLTPPRGGRAT